GDRARDLGDLDRVGEARPVVVALGRDEDLRLVLEAPERGRGDHPLPIALEGRPVGMLGLSEGAAARRSGQDGVGSEVSLLPLLELVTETEAAQRSSTARAVEHYPRGCVTCPSRSLPGLRAPRSTSRRR